MVLGLSKLSKTMRVRTPQFYFLLTLDPSQYSVAGCTWKSSLDRVVSLFGNCKLLLRDQPNKVTFFCLRGVQFKTSS